MENPVFIIAEIAQAHDGSLGIAHSYIDAVATTGVDAIKFQTHLAEAESSVHEPFRVSFSHEDKTRYEYWKRMEFTLDQWKDLKAHCDEVGPEFMSSPFSNAAVDLLEEVGVKRHKIGSGEVSNYLLLEKVARTGKDIILSSGMSSWAELDEAVEFLRTFGNRLTVLECTTMYPTLPQEVRLNIITKLRERYGIPVGLSDHSGTIYPSLGAVALGAEIVEVHVVFDKRMFGPDSSSSLTIEELKQMVEGVRFLEKALEGKSDKDDISRFQDVKRVFEKSLAVNKGLAKGSVIGFTDLEGKKPFGYGIPARDYREVIGRKVNKDIEKWTFLQQGDLQ
jgi:N,N'-diacetyllegionaminate synthase